MWLSTASAYRRCLPMRWMSTGIGTLPLRKPGILTLPARSDAACSTACLTSALGTSTVRRTLLSPSSSTCACIARPLEQTGFGLGRAPVYRVDARGRGGIGKRARFRSWWASALRGSSPLARTLSSRVRPEHDETARADDGERRDQDRRPRRFRVVLGGGRLRSGRPLRGFVHVHREA